MGEKYEGTERVRLLELIDDYPVEIERLLDAIVFEVEVTCVEGTDGAGREFTEIEVTERPSMVIERIPSHSDESEHEEYTVKIHDVHDEIAELVSGAIENGDVLVGGNPA